MLNLLQTTFNIAKNHLPAVLQPYQSRLQYVVCDDAYQLPMTVIGQGKPVLMLHALGMDARQFLPFILPLLNNYCFYLPHLRGFGLSADSPTTKFDFIEQYVDDVEIILSDICTQHNTKSVDVAAISMGALVMWAYFNRHCAKINTTNLDKTWCTHKVQRYLNIDQMPVVHHQPNWQGGVFGDKQHNIFNQFQDVIHATHTYFSKAQPSTIKIPNFTHLPFSIKRKITKMEYKFSLVSVHRNHSKWITHVTNYKSSHKLALFNHPNWQQKLRCVQAYLEIPYDYRTALPNIDIPVTMLIGGKSELYSPVWQHQIADQLNNSKTVEFPHSGHAIPMDAPLAFIKALTQFLSYS